MPTEITIAFWNVQNLFQPGTVARGPQSQAELDKKLSVLANEVNDFFSSDGPDLLGLAEVHDRDIFDALADLLGDDYLRIWEGASQSDQTGLGVLARESAFEDFTLLDVFRPTAGSRPRSLLTACKPDGASASFVFCVNHWKSRMGVPETNNEDRLETANWVAEQLKTSPIECAVVAGDFNAEPYEEPFAGKLRGRRNFRGAFSTSDAFFMYNTAWKFLGEPVLWEEFDVAGYAETRPSASHDASTVNLFDHLLVSKRAMRDGTLTLQESTVEFLCNDVTSRHNTHGVLRPKRWKYESATDFEGSSDHFPLLARFDVA